MKFDELSQPRDELFLTKILVKLCTNHFIYLIFNFQTTDNWDVPYYGQISRYISPVLSK